MTKENTEAGILITGSPDNDSIINFGDDVTIDSSSGNDTIYSGLDDKKADRVSINAGAGDNVVSIQGGSDSVTIRTGDGNNLIGSTSPNNAIFSGAGNDSVVFYTGADNNTLETGDGDDVIDAVGHNVKIDAGAGNDKIRTYRNAYDITIKASTGDDDIILGGPVDTDHTNVVQYADGDGNDTISALTAADTLQITSGSISGASLVGNNIEISVGNGTITLVEANNININIVDADGVLNQTIFSGGSSDDTVTNDTLIVGTDGDDYLANDKGKNVTITGLGGNDTIENTGDSSIIDAGAGNNVVSVAAASFVTVTTGDGSNTVYSDSNGASEVINFGNGKNSLVTSNRYSTITGGSGGNGITLHNGSFGSYAEAGNGDDTVAVGHYDITVDAGAGNDLINLYRDAENSLIIMGTGNDTVAVYNNDHAQTFQYSGGNDLISGFEANDTLRIVGHAVSSSIISDGNFIFDFGDGKLTLAGVSSIESLNVEYPGKWSTLEGGGWEYYSVVKRDMLGNKRNDKAAQFSISGGNLKDEDGNGIPDNVSIGSIIYVQQSGVHTNVNHLSGNVIYNGDALGIQGDDDYNIEAISPIDTSESFPYNVYITDPNVTAIRGVSNGATISPRGTAGTSTAADWISIDSTSSKVTFLDGVYCVYTENIFSTRDYTKLTIANSNNGVEVSTADDLIQTIGNLADGYEITIESGINVGEKINFETEGNGVIVVKTTANTSKYSLDADSDEWQYQRFSINGGGSFAVVFGENGSIVGMENFDGMLQSNDTSLINGEWVTLSSGGKFQYTGNALNNPSKYVSFVISGDKITSTDNLSVERIVYMPAQDACRVELNGINGNATIDDVELGVSGDSLYTAYFTETANGIQNNIALMQVSDGASINNDYSVGIDDNTAQIQFSDGNHVIFTNSYFSTQDFTTINADNAENGFTLNINDEKFSTISGLSNGYAISINAGGNIGDELTFQTDGGNGSIAIADETLSAGGENDFTVEFDDDGKVIFDSWTTIDGGFVYSGHATNNYAKTADVSLIGSDLKDSDGDGAPDNVSVNSFTYSNVTGVMAFMSGFSGEVTLNNKAVGVSGDDDYEVHFTAKVIDNASEEVQRYAATKELHGISTGATVNPNANDIVGFDENAKAHVGDVTKFFIYNKNHKAGGSPHAQIGIANNGAGADLTIEDGILTGIGGLENGYSISLVSSDNVSDELTFQTDGGNGSIAIGNTTLIADGDKDFAIKLDDDGNIAGLKNFDYSPAQVISDFTGIDVDDLDKVSVTNADELAALKDAETSVLEISGNQNVDLRKFDNAQIVSLGSGRQTVKFNDKDDNVAVVDENASGRKNIVFGKGKDLGIFNSENANVQVDLSKASNTTIAPYAGSVTLEGYKDSSILIPNVEDIVGAVMENAINFDRDKIKTDSATVKFDSAADSRLVNLVTEGGDLQKVGFVKGGVLKLGSVRGNYLLKGDADSTITAGSGNDTILAGEGNKIDAGAGNNQIYLTENSESTIVMRSGKATVQNFKAGFENSDRLFFGTNDAVNFKFDGNDLKVYNNGTLRGVLSNVADGADFVNILAADDNSAPKIAVAQTGAVITVEDEIADLYIGKNSAVDFTSFEDSLTVDLTKNFYGINQITAGSGFNTLRGSSRRETLTGNSDGITEFIFGACGGRDVISNFNFDDDKINVGSDAVTDVRLNSDGDVRLQVGGGEDWLTIEDAQGKHFSINGFTAKVDNNIDFDDTANYFVATSRNATLTVGNDVEGDAIIWLDNPARNGSVFKGDIRTLDAHDFDGRAELAGNDLNNTIYGGSGSNSLWGGNGGDDLLVGGAGKNTFFYTNGNDTISGANDGDSVILSGVTLEQIAGTNITAGGVEINFKDGGSLQIDGTADVTYQLADGSKFSANHESHNWDSK